MLASLLTVATQSDPDSTTRTRIDCQDITSKQDKTPTSRRSSWTTRRCRPLLQARSPSLTTSRPILLRTHGQGGIAKPRRSPHRREVLCEVRWPMPTWWWCCQAPELARSRDYFSRASRWGGQSAEVRYFRAVLPPHHAESTCRRLWRSLGPSCGCPALNHRDNQ